MWTLVAVYGKSVLVFGVYMLLCKFSDSKLGLAGYLELQAIQLYTDLLYIYYFILFYFLLVSSY